ncbi:reverse transcriptase [Gossypium australe]|uniref:Reverse transcriptase n=1 Tax=Gossypium australe TaxID=47621 RepID=A0A5B6X0F5_9ROSI|nr:reverse transcriptase [Gossypium australe]
MEAFRKVLEDCKLADLGFSGQWYTWERGRLANNNIREGLDRGVANPNFSDNCPLIVNTNKNRDSYNSGQSRQFRFNADWILSPKCEEHIKNVWDSNTQDVLVKLKELGRSLGWSKGEKKSRDQCAYELNGRLRELGDCKISKDVLEEITGIKMKRFIGSKEQELIGLKWGTRIQLSFIKVHHIEEGKIRSRGWRMN